MKALLKKLKAKWERPTKFQVKFLFTGMDLKTWRENPELIAWARSLWEKQEWQHALSALRNAAPIGYPLRRRELTGPITAEEAVLELGRKEGYQDCLNAIYSLTMRVSAQTEEIEADFDQTKPFEE